MSRRRFDPEAARAARAAELLALMPPNLAAPLQAEWLALAELLADDPPLVEPARMRSLLLQYCRVKVRHDECLAQVPTVRHQVFREKLPDGREVVKVNPFVAMRDKAAAELLELAEALELTPRAVRKRKASPFDAV